MEDISIIERRYNILTGTDDMIAILTPGRVRKHVNKSYCTFFGKSATELIGTSPIDSFHDSKKKFYHSFIMGMSPKTPSIETVQKSGPNDNDRWIHWIENGIYDAQGNLTEILTIGRDVDEKINVKKQKDEMTNLLKAYRDAIDTNVICSITDKRGIITYVNSHFCEVSKYNAEELLGKSHAIINSGHHPKEFFAEMWQRLLSGNMWHGEIKNKAKDGSYYWVKTVIIPVRDTDKNINSFLSLRVLITDRKQLEEERMLYLKSLEEMIFMVSHELRKPISNCLGLLTLMRTFMADNQEYQKMIAYMIESTHELDGYSRKMNDYLYNHKINSAAIS